MLGLQRAELGEDWLRTFMLEAVEPLLQPLGWKLGACLGGELPDRADLFGSMRKIQDADRLGTMVVGEALQPLRSIRHRTHRVGLFHSSSMQFHQRLLATGLDSGQP